MILAYKRAVARSHPYNTDYLQEYQAEISYLRSLLGEYFSVSNIRFIDRNRLVVNQIVAMAERIAYEERKEEFSQQYKAPFTAEKQQMRIAILKELVAQIA